VTTLTRLERQIGQVYTSEAVETDDLAAHRRRDDARVGVGAALIEALVRAGMVIVDQERVGRQKSVDDLRGLLIDDPAAMLDLVRLVLATLVAATRNRQRLVVENLSSS